MFGKKKEKMNNNQFTEDQLKEINSMLDDRNRVVKGKPDTFTVVLRDRGIKTVKAHAYEITDNYVTFIKTTYTKQPTRFYFRTHYNGGRDLYITKKWDYSNSIVYSVNKDEVISIERAD